MRHLALLAVVLPSIVLPSIAVAQNAPSGAAPKGSAPKNDTAKNDTSKNDTSKDDTPKGRIVDPWGRLPHPRDHMRLPDPRKAAEKATSDGTVAPTPQEPTPPTGEQVTADPAAAPAPPPAPPPATMPPPPPQKTPFRTTKLAVVAPPPPAPHEGLTLEAGIGVGFIHVSDDSRSMFSTGGVAGLSLGIGGWLDERVALTARLAGSSVPKSGGVLVAGFLGPSLQFWVSESTWLGAGFGIAVYGFDATGTGNDYSLRGYGGDLRLGHTFYANGSHTLNGSFELTPSHVSENVYGSDIAFTVTSIGFLFGWQYL
jgi:hypothetical protein